MWNTVPIQDATPPAAFPPIHTDRTSKIDVTPAYTALAGLAVGAAGMRVHGQRDKREQGQDNSKEE
jgi:hydrogenase small subunit